MAKGCDQGGGGLGHATRPRGGLAGPPLARLCSIYSSYITKIILQKSLLHLELQKISFSSVDILGPDFQLSDNFPLFVFLAF